MACSARCSCDRPCSCVPDLDQRLADLLDAGRIAQGDVDVVQDFRAFLADPEVPRRRPLPVSVMRRYQVLLGLSDGEIDEVERRRAAASSGGGL